MGAVQRRGLWQFSETKSERDEMQEDLAHTSTEQRNLGKAVALLMLTVQGE